MKIDGQCHCGNLRFVAEIDPADVTICHCEDCQRMSGSAYRVNVRVETAAFEMTGQPALYERTAESGRARVHAFCPRCGTNIYSTGTGEAAQVLSLRTGMVRQRRDLKPSRQIWCRSALGWVPELPGTKRFETS